MAQLIPRRQVPALEAETVDSGVWRMADQSPENFTLVMVHRGLHYPILKRNLAELQECLPEFQNLGIEVIALTSDPEERAVEAKWECKLAKLTIGYGLSIEKDYPARGARKG